MTGGWSVATQTDGVSIRQSPSYSCDGPSSGKQSLLQVRRTRAGRPRQEWESPGIPATFSRRKSPPGDSDFTLGALRGNKKARPGQLVRTRIWPRRANSPDAHRISYGALPPLPSSVRVVRTPLEYDKPWYSKKNSHQRQEQSRIALTAENRSHGRFRTPDNCLIRFGVPCGKVPLKNSPDLRYLRSHLCLLNPSPSLSEKTI